MSGDAARRSLGPLPAERTTYVGRRTELIETRRLLGAASLVTLTGPGGVGKTRLALQAAAAARASFADDVVFVGLAELREPELLVNTVADHLGSGDRSARPPIDLLVEQLRARRLLLVLDNCEHLVEACARLVGTLLAGCPDLVVLATSRQSLGVAGERILPVSPLAVPEPGESTAGLEQYEGVQLFVDRATAVVPSFAITEENAADVTRLCQALDGLPLAIELAAVRLRSLSVRQLADRLDNRFTLLTGGRRSGPSRHATFQALIDWSHELCTEQERLLWARTSVFSGTFGLDAAEEVCSAGGLDRHAVLDVLDGLLDKSILLRQERDDVVRYRMLEPVRQYGEDRLQAAGDLVRMRRRHRDWYLELARQFAAEWFGADQIAWITRLKQEHANLRGALDFCSTEPGEAAAGLDLVHGVKEYWVLRGLNTEGRMWLGKLLDVAPNDSPGRASGSWMYAFLALVQSDLPAFDTALARAADAAEELGDERSRAYVHHVRAYAALIDDQADTAADLFHQAAEEFRRQRDFGGLLWARYNHGLAISLAGDLERGRQVLRDCVAECVERGEVFWRSWALWSRSAAEYLRGDMEQAEQAGLELLRLQRRVDDRAIIAFSLTVMAGCATHRGDPRRAARLLGAATTVWQWLGASPTNYAAFVEPMERDIGLVTGELGAEEAAKEFATGAELSAEQAVRHALGEAQDGAEATVEPPPDPLTKRETEIAELVTQGLTNRDIADRLVIARRTAETHVDHILGKLGFTSRAQIAAWFVESRRS
ncbi:ATP-binding protein [Amycolatopsis cihanbeyliensis]|uniref:Non-specific serine/threonine protein kinase n=1 Tax=Amycolatopsis cihanbeyliensis TaxID=1128664 RepID=A0A542DE78_AMYCI|nr:LuxR C-terminal-related transcriptional regulator [Amycolatopsis cihanbeyliensis]TQJ01381.1 non-specific serine/threonine protein kinase [Amycolatopsis cihanbeyliensis]